MAQKVYEIIIKDQTTGGRKTTATAMNGTVTTETKQKAKSGEESGASFKDMVAGYHYAKQALQTIASYEISTIELRTGSVRAQQKAQFAYQCVNEASNVLESTIVGFATGGGVGALIGTAVGLVTKVVNYGLNAQRLNLAQSVENVTLAQNAIRIGAGGDRMGAVK